MRSPPVISSDRPMPTKPMLRLAMKEGMRSSTCTRPLTSPNSAPTRMQAGSAIQPQPASVPPSAVKIIAKTTAQTATAPSIDRSIDPMMMMKVTPSATISAGVAEMLMRAKLRSDRKLGLIQGEEDHQHDQHQQRRPFVQSIPARQRHVHLLEAGTQRHPGRGDGTPSHDRAARPALSTMILWPHAAMTAAREPLSRDQ